MKPRPYVGEIVTRGERMLQYEHSGRRGHCLCEIEALQPGGLEVRHVESRVPYGECEQAKNKKEKT